MKMSGNEVNAPTNLSSPESPLVARVDVHPSQFPAAIDQAFHDCIGLRQIEPRFHYETPKQAGQWLRLHETCSPARNDISCQEAYEACFTRAAEMSVERGKPVHVVGAGCGGGQKEATLLRTLAASGNGAARYSPWDVSLPLTLQARIAALGMVKASSIHPLVVDFNRANDLDQWLDHVDGAAEIRMITFFGMLPNLPPESLRRVAAWARQGDYVMAGANLAPGENYRRGCESVLPLYDNALTRDWLMMVLLDLGVNEGDGELKFSLGGCPSGKDLLRIEAKFRFSRDRRIRIPGLEELFREGEEILLFYSYRYTPSRMAGLIDSSGLRLIEQWSNTGGDDGVYLCEAAPRQPS